LILELLYAMLVEKGLIKRALIKIAVITFIGMMVTKSQYNSWTLNGTIWSLYF
jgi:hypothetical protein